MAREESVTTSFEAEVIAHTLSGAGKTKIGTDERGEFVEVRNPRGSKEEAIKIHIGSLTPEEQEASEKARRR